MVHVGKKKNIILSFLIGCFTFLFGLPHSTAAEPVLPEPSPQPPATQESTSSPLNVKSFGAKGDGVTDDSASIQKAFDSIKDNGAVFFPKGTYRFEKTITIPSYIRITGESKRSSILLYKGTDKALVSGDRTGKYGNGSYHITIEDIALQGSDAGTALYITSRYLTVNNTEISHFGVGIDAQYCWTNKFYNVTIFYNTIGFIGGSFLNANSFVNCIFAAGKKGVTFTQGWNIAFTGCQFEAFSEACFSFNEEAKDAIWNLTITGCYFENNGKTIDAGPNCALYGLAFTNNIITTHGNGLAVRIDNANGYGRNTGVIENNTFIRDNNGTTEPFVRLNGPAYLMFRANQGYAAPGNGRVPVLDDATRNTNTTFVEEVLTDGNKFTISGTGVFNKGVVVGSSIPATADRGLMVYDNGKLKIYVDSGNFEYVQTGKSGPSSARPSNPYPGMIYFDTTLNLPVWWNGTVWVDANGQRR
jgi:hypothetical protein